MLEAIEGLCLVAWVRVSGNKPEQEGKSIRASSTIFYGAHGLLEKIVRVPGKRICAQPLPNPVPISVERRDR